MKKKNASLTWIPAVILGVVCAVAPCPAQAQSGYCASAWIAEPFILPDGSVHSPGNLKICTAAPMSPVSQLQRTYVDGMPIGAFVSRRQTGELNVTDKDPAIFVFQRDLESRLRLERYAVWDGSKALAFDMTASAPKGMTVARRDCKPLAPLPPVRETIVVVASRN